MYRIRYSDIATIENIINRFNESGKKENGEVAKNLAFNRSLTYTSLKKLIGEEGAAYIAVAVMDVVSRERGRTIKYGLHFDQNDLEHILQVVARKQGLVKTMEYFPYLDKGSLPMNVFIRNLFKETASITDRLSAWPGSREALRSKTEAKEKANQLKWAFTVLQAWLNGYNPDSEEGQAVLDLVDKSFIQKALGKK